MRSGAETKARIERAALRLFVEKGITQTTVRDITQAVGITEGALYRHFTSKDELANTLFADNYAAFAAALERARQPGAPFPDTLAAMIELFCSFFDRDRDLFSYLLLAQHDAGRQAPPETRSPVAVVRAVVAEAVERGEIAEGEPDFLTAAVLGIVLEVAIFIVYGHLEGPLARHAPAIRAACLRAVGASA